MLINSMQHLVLCISRGPNACKTNEVISASREARMFIKLMKIICCCSFREARMLVKLMKYWVLCISGSPNAYKTNEIIGSLEFGRPECL